MKKSTLEEQGGQGVLKKDDIHVDSDRYFTVVTSTIGSLAAMYVVEGTKESKEEDSGK